MRLNAKSEGREVSAVEHGGVGKSRPGGDDDRYLRGFYGKTRNQ